MKSSYLSVYLLILSVSLYAQEECPCCTETHSQFDFWIGDWMVLDTLGNKLGENLISKIENGCILAEHWKGAQGGSGSSFNYYDKTDSTWNQLWIDNSGNVLKLKGSFQLDKMVMKSDLQKGTRVDWYYNQITWSPGIDGTVSQLWQIFDKDDRLLQTAFLGIYHKKK